MTYDEIKNKFLVIGTYSKQPAEDDKIKLTKRLQRVMVGRKGVGRFALEKLGGKVRIISKPFDTLDKLEFEINWRAFEVEDVNVDAIPIEISTGTREDKDDSGLEIEITDLNDTWEKESILEFKQSLKSLILPEALQSPNPFEVYLEATLFGIDRDKVETELEETSFYYLEAELTEDTIEVYSKKLGKKTPFRFIKRN